MYIDLAVIQGAALAGFTGLWVINKLTFPNVVFLNYIPFITINNVLCITIKALSGEQSNKATSCTVLKTYHVYISLLIHHSLS